MPSRLPLPFKARPAESTPSLSDILSARRLQRVAVPVEDETNGWALTFGDLVLLLLCFFVLWHMAEKQQLLAQIELAEQTTPAVPAAHANRARQAKRTTQDAAGQNIPNIPAKEAEFAERAERTASVFPPIQLPSLVPQPEFVSSHQPPSSDYPADTLSVAQTPLQPVPILVPFAPQVAAPTLDQSWQVLADQIEQYADEHEFEHMVGVVSSEHEFVISLSDMITFPSGEATLGSGVMPILEYVVQLAETKPQLLVEITGHTDDRPIATLAFPSNWELSTARASRVTRALLNRSDIDPARISAQGYAHYRPLYENDIDDHRAANRRVEIRFFRPLASPSIVRATTQAATVPFNRDLALSSPEQRPLSQ